MSGKWNKEISSVRRYSLSGSLQIPCPGVGRLLLNWFALPMHILASAWTCSDLCSLYEVDVYSTLCWRVELWYLRALFTITQAKPLSPDAVLSMRLVLASVITAGMKVNWLEVMNMCNSNVRPLPDSIFRELTVTLLRKCQGSCRRCCCNMPCRRLWDCNTGLVFVLFWGFDL